MTCAANGCDFHCHVDLFPDPAALIADCDRRRIVTLAVTTTPKAWTQNRRWMANSRFVFPALGLHPELAGERHDEIALLEELMEDTPFVGEVGLDGSPQHRQTWKVQKLVFTRALHTAQRLGGRVLSIHSRRAAREVLACLEETTTSERVLPILHWFSDNVSVAKKAAEQGCYFSINHRMLAADSATALVRNFPSDRLLTETDAPFTEIDGRKSEPRDVLGTIETLARLRDVSVDEATDTVRANTSRVFAFAGLDGLLNELGSA